MSKERQAAHSGVPNKPSRQSFAYYQQGLVAEDRRMVVESGRSQGSKNPTSFYFRALSGSGREGRDNAVFHFIYVQVSVKEIFCLEKINDRDSLLAFVFIFLQPLVRKIVVLSVHGKRAVAFPLNVTSVTQSNTSLSHSQADRLYSSVFTAI